MTIFDTMLDAPAWGPQGQAIFERTYSRPKPDGSMETWADTVRRVVHGNLGLVGPEHHLPGEADHLFDIIYHFRAIPAGRHLWVSGVPDRPYSRNCHRAGWGSKLSDHFGFLFSELMKGGGVGSNYSSEYLESMPPVVGKTSVDFICRPDHPDLAEFDTQLSTVVPGSGVAYRVEDSREGWVKALEIMVDAFTTDSMSILVFDVSDIRPRGSAIKQFGGTASGPGPLITALQDTAAVLRGCGNTLTPLAAMEIDHALAACVISGNVRRSARMSILHWQDPDIFDFIGCKADHSKHWTTNLSVEVDEDFFLALNMGEEHATKVFELVSEMALHNGEPGFFNSSAASVGERGDVRSTNPCGEIALEDFEACNLGSVNLASIHKSDPAEAEVIFRLMARFLLRATCAPITDPRQAAIEGANRRIGVGIFGTQEWAAERGVRYSEIHKSEPLAHELEAYRYAAQDEAASYAAELGIPAPIKTTTVAPTGTTAKLAGVTEGAHPVFARFYERRIRYADNDPSLLAFGVLGLQIEDCIYSNATKVVVHHVKDPIVERFPVELIEQASEVPLETMLRTQAFFQEHFADNAVSFTANFDPEMSLESLQEALRAVLPHLKGTTLMPNHSRPQSPYTPISEEAYLAASDHELGQALEDCASGACPIR